MDRIQLRRDSSARWAEVNPILLEGEVGFETDTKLRKIGDGVHRWNELEYLRAEGIVQESGDGENVVMSQKAVSEKINKLEGKIEVGERILDFNYSSLIVSSNDVYADSSNYKSLVYTYSGKNITVKKKKDGVLTISFLVDTIGDKGNTPNFADGTKRTQYTLKKEESISLECPNGTNYICITIPISSTEEDEYIVYDDASIINKLQGLGNEVGALNEKAISFDKVLQTPTMVTAIPLSYGVIGEIGGKITYGTTTTYRHYKIDIKAEQKVSVRIVGRAAVSKYIYACDDNDTIIGIAERSVSTDNTPLYIEYEIPSECKKLYINTYSVGMEDDYIILSTTIDKKVESIENRVNNINVLYPLSVFHKIAVIGGSWDSGYFSTNGTDRYESNSHSWLANAARMNGVDYHCFARKSTWTRRWLTTDAQWGKTRLEQSDACDLYILTFAGNDAQYGGLEYLGTMADINDNDYTLNADTFYGNYAKIISLIREKSPNARIVCVSWYYEGISNGEIKSQFISAVDNIASKYGLPRIKWEDDEWYLSTLSNTDNLIGDHPTTMQLCGIAKSFERLMSKCISKNYDYFNKWYNHSADDVEVIR